MAGGAAGGRGAGGVAEGPLPHDPGPHWGEVGIHGLHRQREWDETATVSAPGAPGDEAWLVVLADGRVLVEAGSAGPAPDRLVAGVKLARPFRARAVHHDGDVWSVAARSLEVVELSGLEGCDAVELVWDGAERSVLLDGVESGLRVPELEQLAASRFAEYVARAQRLNGRLWEVNVLPL